MTTLVCFEPLLDGHVTDWAGMICAAGLADARVRRVVLAADPVLLERLAERPGLEGLDPLPLPPDVLRACRTGAPLARGLAQWAGLRGAMRAAARDGGPVAGLLPYLDQGLAGAALDRRTLPGPVAGVLIRTPDMRDPAPAERRRRLRMRVLLRAAARPGLRGVFCLDPGFARETVRALPDPVVHADLLQGGAPTLRPPAGRRGVLVLGAISARKGVHELLAACAALPEEDAAGLDLHLAGRILDEERAAIAAACAATRRARPTLSLRCSDAFLSPREMAGLVRGADAVAVAYRGHRGSSGIVLQAAMAARPVIAQRDGLIGAMARAHGLGPVVDPADTGALRDCLAGLVRAGTLPHDPAAMAALARAHMPDAFTAPLLDAVLPRRPG